MGELLDPLPSPFHCPWPILSTPPPEGVPLAYHRAAKVRPTWYSQELRG